MRQLLVACAFCLVASSALADIAFEAIEHSCDSSSQTLRILYHQFWNDPPPTSSNLITTYGVHRRSCVLPKLRIETVLGLEEPRATGHCGALPGGFIESLKVNGITLLIDVPFNQCDPDWLDEISIRLVGNDLEVTYCGSHGLEAGLQGGCFVDHRPLSARPQPPYARGIPYERYQPEELLSGAIRPIDAELIIAAARGDVDTTSKLIAQGANPDIPDSNGSPLYNASLHRNASLVRALLSTPATSTFRQTQLDRSLYVVAVVGDAELTEILLTAGANPNTRMDDFSVLFSTVSNAQYGNAFRASEYKRPPADFLSTVKLLVSHGADPLSTGSGRGKSNQGTALDVARRLRLDEIEAILSGGKAPRQ
jgi:hypothetical protein